MYIFYIFRQFSSGIFHDFLSHNYFVFVLLFTNIRMYANKLFILFAAKRNIISPIGSFSFRRKQLLDHTLAFIVPGISHAEAFQPLGYQLIAQRPCILKRNLSPALKKINYLQSLILAFAALKMICNIGNPGVILFEITFKLASQRRKVRL